MTKSRCPARVKRRGRSRSRHGAASRSPKPTNRAAPRKRWRRRRRWQQFRRRVDRYGVGLRQHHHNDRRHHQRQDGFRGRLGEPSTPPASATASAFTTASPVTSTGARPAAAATERFEHRNWLHGFNARWRPKQVKQPLLLRLGTLPMRIAIRCSIGIGVLSLVMSTVLGPSPHSRKAAPAAASATTRSRCPVRGSAAVGRETGTAQQAEADEPRRAHGKAVAAAVAAAISTAPGCSVLSAAIAGQQPPLSL